MKRRNSFRLRLQELDANGLNLRRVLPPSPHGGRIRVLMRFSSCRVRFRSTTGLRREYAPIVHIRRERADPEGSVRPWKGDAMQRQPDRTDTRRRLAAYVGLGIAVRAANCEDVLRRPRLWRAGCGVTLADPLGCAQRYVDAGTPSRAIQRAPGRRRLASSRSLAGSAIMASRLASTAVRSAGMQDA